MRILLLFCFISVLSHAQTVDFKVSIPAPEKNEFYLEFSAGIEPSAFTDLALPAWSPGYYQLMNFGKNVISFFPENEKGEALRWVKFGDNTWRVYTAFSSRLTIRYTVKAARSFVAAAYVDTSRAFLKPAALFLYPQGKLNTPVNLSLNLPPSWKVATGLNPAPGKGFSYTAPDFDVLFDSPLLAGPLRELPSFSVGGKAHRFLGYNMGEFDETALMNDLQKLIKTASDIFGDIPYDHYTFIGIGPGNGGIEQLNSTAVAFSGKSLEGNGRIRTLSFLTHEYFHHYNAKRIRPVELGPFDYSGPNRTNGLWVAEGLTAYYEDIIMNRAGFLPRPQMLKAWGDAIASFQKNEGRLKQSLAESSACTWEDGPFGKKGETISYYDKGPLVGMILDLRIREATKNRKCLDDVMRILYHDFYKKKNRGFTDEEMIRTCEQVAGTSLDEVFQYVYTTKEMDYKHFFNRIGVEVDDQFNLRIQRELNPLQKKIIDDLFRL